MVASKTPGRKAREEREEKQVQRLSEQFVRDQFHIRPHPIYGEAKMTAGGKYWNQGRQTNPTTGERFEAAIAVTISFDSWDGYVNYWCAYIGATLETMHDHDAYDFAVAHGVKLHEDEARQMLHRFRDVLSRLPYRH